MSNKEQTAVDWLFKQLWDEPQDKFTWYAILKQALAMHKEETCQFVSDYLDDADYGMTAEEYYNQIYGGNNE